MIANFSNEQKSFLFPKNSLQPQLVQKIQKIKGGGVGGVVDRGEQHCCWHGYLIECVLFLWQNLDLDSLQASRRLFPFPSYNSLCSA